MEEAGLFRFWEEKYFLPNQCDAEAKEKLKPVSRAMTIFDVAAAFVILAIGMGASLLCCTLEIYCKKNVNAGFCKKRILKQGMIMEASNSWSNHTVLLRDRDWHWDRDQHKRKQWGPSSCVM